MTRIGQIKGLTLILSVLIATAIGLTACGRKGPLERPAAAKAGPPEQQAADATVRGPSKPFILDRLLR